ncbi:MAG TPA: hypothetical protein VLZ81_05735, partial [Blastocatellia bacterium]|nr:hypothetical protein [Blastocatellia bacterium]
LRLEWRALKAALSASSDQRRLATSDALTFRAYRRQLFSNAAAEERALEMNEGLAEYTGVVLAADSTRAAVNAVTSELERRDNSPSFVRSFAYASGPAYGLLLDESGVEWRKGLTAVIDMGTLLENAYESKLPSDLAAAAAKQALKYDGEKVIAEEHSRAEKHKELIAAYRAKLVDGPVLVLRSTDHINYSFDPNNLLPLDGASTIYPTLSVHDEWGSLEVTDGALLVRNENGIDRVQTTAPAEIKSRRLSGDGWTLELADGWKVAPGQRSGDYTVTKAK